MGRSNRCPLTFGILALVTATLPIAEGPSMAQDRVTLFVDANAIDANVIEYVAKVSKPIKITAHAGQTLEDVLSNVCGRIDPLYVELLKKVSATGLPDPIDLDAKFDSDRTLELPACLKLPRFAVERVAHARKEDIPWQRYTADAAGFHRFGAVAAKPQRSAEESVPLPSFVAYSHHDLLEAEPAFAQAESQPTADLNSYLEAFVRLNPSYAKSGVVAAGKPLNVPRSPEAWTSLELAKRSEFRTVVDELSDLLTAAGQEASTVRVEDPEEIYLYSQLSKAQLDKWGACRERLTASAFSSVDLVEVIGTNLTALREKREEPGRTTIIIADTGLHSNGSLPFPPNERFLDTEEYVPLPGSEQRHHGTFVATLALGGVEFMKLLPGLPITFKLFPTNIYREDLHPCIATGGSSCPRHLVKTDAFNNAIDNATSAILNLSVGRAVPMRSVSGQLGRQSTILFVVAAGNDGKSLVTRPVYPARYGGPRTGSDNLVTVAALDTDDTLAAFSNHGRDYVDIAAPGCDREVLRYDETKELFAIDRASGTSFAAPLVSFTTALLRAFWLGAKPYELKQRVLIGADIVPQLSDSVFNGGKLNVIKTLSIYQDVAEIEVDGTVRTIRGTIEPSNFTLDFCDERISVSRNANAHYLELKKLTAVTAAGTGGKKFLLYWTDAEGVLQYETCPQIDLPFSIRDGFTGTVYPLATDQVVDIVFAEL